MFYREAERIGGKGLERVYYIVFKQGGKVFEEKVGRQYSADMNPARAARIRAERIEGRRQSRKEIREAAKVVGWTIDRLWQEYDAGWRTDGGRYENHLKAAFGGKEPCNISQLDIHRLRITLTQTLKPQTVKHVLILLQRIINHGVKRGLCGGLGFKIEMPKVNNLRTEDLNPEQLADLIEAINTEHEH